MNDHEYSSILMDAMATAEPAIKTAVKTYWSEGAGVVAEKAADELKHFCMRVMAHCRPEYQDGFDGRTQEIEARSLRALDRISARFESEVSYPYSGQGGAHEAIRAVVTESVRELDALRKEDLARALKEQQNAAVAMHQRSMQEYWREIDSRFNAIEAEESQEIADAFDRYGEQQPSYPFAVLRATVATARMRGMAKRQLAIREVLGLTDRQAETAWGRQEELGVTDRRILVYLSGGSRSYGEIGRALREDRATWGDVPDGVLLSAIERLMGRGYIWPVGNEYGLTTQGDKIVKLYPAEGSGGEPAHPVLSDPLPYDVREDGYETLEVTVDRRLMSSATLAFIKYHLTDSLYRQVEEMPTSGVDVRRALLALRRELGGQWQSAAMKLGASAVFRGEGTGEQMGVSPAISDLSPEPPSLR